MVSKYVSNFSVLRPVSLYGYISAKGEEEGMREGTVGKMMWGKGCGEKGCGLSLIHI